MNLEQNEWFILLAAAFIFGARGGKGAGQIMRGIRSTGRGIATIGRGAIFFLAVIALVYYLVYMSS